MFVENLAEGRHSLETATLKVLLANSAPAATYANTSQVSEIPAQNGYLANGKTATVTSSAQSSGTYKLVIADVVWTASGGTIGPFQYAVLYDWKNGVGYKNPVIAYWNYGSTVTLQNGETFTVDFDATNGVLQIV